MRSWARKNALRLAGAGLAAVGAILAAAILIGWSGVYNVAASRGHWTVTEWVLAFVMRNSVEKRSLAITPPALDNPSLVRLGAAHFHGGCASCHGAPGMPSSPIAQHMLPPPPDLAVVAEQWKDRELFWITKHGIKYTGMPAWASQQRDDEVWAVVAFLKQLPRLDAEGYRTLAIGDLPTAPPDGRRIATANPAAAAVGACGRCHAVDDRRPPSELVPMLHGQPAEFLSAALRSYANGRRESGIMQPVASDLTSEAIRRVADYYAGLAPSVAPVRTRTIDAAATENGRVLATRGDPDAKIPSCVTCHGAGALNVYPRLAGQNAAYMRGRLRLWKGGLATRSDTAAIMAPIARRLSDRQIEDVTAYFESDAPSANGAHRP
jgi:cytochrome c553